MTKPNLFLVFAIAAALLLTWLGFKSCDRQEESAKAPAAKSETIRQRVATTNATESAKYQTNDAKLLAVIEALRSDLATETGKRKAAEQKARESAAEYAKNRTLDNCDKALTDCQEESETKSYSLAVSERMIAGYESSDSLHREEIDRLVAVSDIRDKGWEEANRKLAKEKGKRFGIGLHLGYGATDTGFSPVVSIGLNYNLVKF